MPDKRPIVIESREAFNGLVVVRALVKILALLLTHKGGACIIG